MLYQHTKNVHSTQTTSDGGLVPKPDQVTAARKEMAGQTTGLVEKLLTDLLSATLSNEIRGIMKQLDLLGCPRHKVETCLLARLCFHEALGDRHADGDWEEHRPQWTEFLQDFGVAPWAIGCALTLGKQFHDQHAGKSPEVLAEEVYKEFLVTTVE